MSRDCQTQCTKMEKKWTVIAHKKQQQKTYINLINILLTYLLFFVMKFLLYWTTTAVFFFFTIHTTCLCVVTILAYCTLTERDISV